MRKEKIILINSNLALDVKNLNKRFEKSDFDLRNVDIEVPCGTIVGNIGRNGAGKTTSISCILDIFSKDSGEIKILGEVFKNQIDIKNKLGIVMDEPNFSLFLTPMQINNVMKNIYENWDEEIFITYLSRFSLPLNKKAKTFSYGMKKKLSLAIALSHGARLLILDEITSGLDPVSRDDILNVLLEFIENPDNSIYLSSHITSDLEKIADYIIFMENGKVVLSEEKDTLMYNYGVMRVLYEDFERVDKNDIIAYKNENGKVDILVKNKENIQRKYGDFLVNMPSLDEILLILVSSEVIE